MVRKNWWRCLWTAPYLLCKPFDPVGPHPIWKLNTPFFLQWWAIKQYENALPRASHRYRAVGTIKWGLGAGGRGCGLSPDFIGNRGKTFPLRRPWIYYSATPDFQTFLQPWYMIHSAPRFILTMLEMKIVFVHVIFFTVVFNTYLESVKDLNFRFCASKLSYMFLANDFFLSYLPGRLDNKL